MKTALVILTRNAVRATDWNAVLAAYATQSLPVARRILFDTASSDDTCALACSYGWEIQAVAPEAFNHGRTRQQAAAMLADAGFDEVIFATQDVLPAGPDTLEQLVSARRQSGAAVAFARQCPPQDTGLDAWMRRHHYPEHSRLKSRRDIPELGLRTAFCSNALAVWDTARILRHGGFPATGFGEDMLLAARLILDGESVLYCAESRCIHGHPDRFGELFRRGRAIGRLHREYPWLIREFGAAEEGLVSTLGLSRLLRYLPELAVKYGGFRWGRHFG